MYYDPDHYGKLTIARLEKRIEQLSKENEELLLENAELKYEVNILS